MSVRVDVISASVLPGLQDYAIRDTMCGVLVTRPSSELQEA